MINELDVTLTDYGLAIECAVFAYMLYRHGRHTSALRTPLTVFFVMSSIASLAGGTWHGFFHDGGQFLWRTTLLALGVSALAAWNVGTCLLSSRSLKRVVMTGAVLMTIAYVFVVVCISYSYLVAVVNYLPALAFLTGTFVAFYVRVRKPELLYGVAGLLLMFVAAGIQWRGADLNLAHFNHNAIYHMVQGVALALFFKAAWWCVDTEHGIESQGEMRSVCRSQIAK